MAINVNINPLRTALLQAECIEYNAANRTSITVDQFCSILLNQRADSLRNKYGMIPPYAFIERFTPTEFTALRALAATEPPVAAFLTKLKKQGVVELTDPDLFTALNYLTTKPTGSPVLAAGRPAQIIDVTIPS